MKILSEMPTGMGGKWVLVKYEEDFYAYGVEQDLNSVLGFPVNQCGTKEKVLAHCESVSKLCKENIEKYQKEFANKNSSGLQLLINSEQKELEMLEEFSRILKTLEN